MELVKGLKVEGERIWMTQWMIRRKVCRKLADEVVRDEAFLLALNGPGRISPRKIASPWNFL